MGSMDDTWKTMFLEHTRAPIYSVSHYIAYLRRFVADTSAASSANSGGSSGGAADKKEEKRRRQASARKAGPSPDGIDPLSYFLRKLKLDLKVSYDSFVRDFVSSENQGVGLLLQLLSNLQSPSTGGGGGKGSSSSSLNTTTTITTTPLDDYKKAVTDEYDCLLCIKFCLRVQSGVNQLMEQTDGLHRIATGVQGSSSKARITCLEILTLCLQLDRRGVERVVEAFTLVRLRTGQSVRFKMVVSMLHTRSPSQVVFQVTCMKFFNTLLNCCPTANQRVYLQHELLSAGLDLLFLEQCAEGDGLEYDDLRREIHEWKTRFIDVDALLKRLKEREAVGGLFWGAEGPLQVSSRVGSVRGHHGVTYFQPEELTGAVTVEYRRGLAGTSSQQSNHTSGVPVWTPHNTSTSPDGQGFHDNGHANEPKADHDNNNDDSDSDFTSVSAQRSPAHFRRKYVTPRQSQPRGMTNGRPVQQQQQQQHPSSSSFNGRIAVQQSSKNGSRNAQQSASSMVSTNGYPQFSSPERRVKPACRDFSSNGVLHEQAANEVVNTTNNASLPQRRHSVESFVDAYGLVIHGRDSGDKDRDGDSDWERHRRLGGRDSPERPQGAQDAYSNFKLRYFSTPDMPRQSTTTRDREKSRNSQNNPQGHRQDTAAFPSVSPVVEVGKNHDGKSGINGLSAQTSEEVLWNSYYPFNKRAFYRGLDSSAAPEGSNNTLPLRAIHSLPSLDNGPADSAGKADQNLHTPAPDYSPTHTPRGSVHSLNAEVARVLHDFENTLRAHEPSRSPSVADGSVAFV
ncbi:uncharacterized protein LOC143292089 [Babylonia areolata]|uniref:uncharacterized protein LOC143292089 n=1 Tax=Babylonia areolata TaxID=304850 RepID=UPI003FD248E8